MLDARTPESNRVLSERIEPSDPRYADLVGRGFNRRFVGKPDYVRMVASRAQVIDAVQTAVRDKMRLVVRSGGHCLEGFVGDPEVRVLIDTSAMTGVYYDAERDAFAIEAGTLLGEVYRRLQRGWGVFLPAGQSPNVGIGGHLLGGAFGFMHRQYGLAADYLQAVEVVVVDEDGTARAIVATREPSDPNHDLWWAHTGGGGGNFGIVTRYWVRSPDATRGDPRALLPRAPESLVVFRATWSWNDIDESAFIKLAVNYGEWCERNSAPGSAECQLFSLLFLLPRANGTLELKGLATGAEGERVFAAHLAAIGDGVTATPTRAEERLPWLGFALRPFPELFVPGMDGALVKVKDALLRKGLSPRQLAAAYPYLARADRHIPGGALGMASYGGRINVVSPGATATPHRSAVIDMAATAGWGDPGEEARSLAWVRELYRDLFTETGGVPVPGPSMDSALINHPDTDLADSRWNTSGVPWHAFYYQDNYERLQAIKRRYDPGNVFRHALSIAPG